MTDKRAIRPEGEPVAALDNAFAKDEGSAIRAEIENALDSDNSVLGEVYRGLRDGMSDEELRVQRGAENPNFVWNYKRTIRALIDGDLPSAPSVASQTATRFRKLLKSVDFSPRNSISAGAAASCPGVSCWRSRRPGRGRTPSSGRHKGSRGAC
jgi:hypothetical protein